MSSAKLVFPVRDIDVSAYREDCTKGEADICIQYLSVSSHLMIRKIGDRCFK